MIISHKYKFIFLKTKKTAGTSFEIALSRYLGEDDVVTPISPECEALRQEKGYRGPRNYRIPLRRYDGHCLLELMRRRVPAFANHNRADYVRRHVAPEIWSSYYKFCFERNPWDKVVSFYYWRWRGKEAMPFRDFVMSNAPLSLRDSGGWPIYGDDDGLLVDRVYRYEDIAEASAEIVERLGLPGELDLPFARGQYRKGSSRAYAELYDDETAARVADVFAKEIAAFGYTFDGEPLAEAPATQPDAATPVLVPA